MLLAGCGRFGFDGQVQPFCDSEPLAAHYADFGSGTVDDPYLICTAAQFASIGLTDAGHHHYRLMADIDLSGFDESNYSPTVLEGSLDGNEYAIRNFSYFAPSQDIVGLFSRAETRAVIRNLRVVNATVTGNDTVGVIAGHFQGQMSNCRTSGIVVGQDEVGGLVGRTSSGLIGTSSANVSVRGRREVGGLIGNLYFGSLANSFATGAVIGVSDVGGLVGQSIAAPISGSFATGDVEGTTGPVGGLVGQVWSGDDALSHVFAIGGVACDSATLSCGPVVGHNMYRFSNVFYGSRSCENTQGACNTIGTQVDDRLGYFFDSTNEPMASWDFEHTWREQPSAFPNIADAESLFLDRSDWGSCSEHLSDAPFAGGRGTLENPFLLCSTDQLLELARNASHWRGHHYRVATRTIDLTGRTFQPIGTASQPFSGSFRGNLATISGLTYTNTSTDYVGLFGRLERATILHLAVQDVNIRGANFVGAVAGRVSTSSILNVHTSGTIQGTNQVGGVAGAVTSDGHVIRVYSRAHVTGIADVGGVVGDATGGWSANMFSTGDVIGGAGQSNIGPTLGNDNVSSLMPDEPWWHRFYSSDALCQNCDTADSSMAVPETWFYTKSNAPMLYWDFENTWQENPQGLPTFRQQ